MSLLLNTLPLKAEESISLIKHFEQYRSRTYVDASGNRTIGYGFKNLKTNFLSYTQADSILNQKIQEIRLELNKVVKIPLTTYQEAALISLIYNIGVPAFRKSRLLKTLNQGNIQQIPGEFNHWIYIGSKPAKGLKIRRKKEAQIFSGQSLPLGVN